MTVVGGGGRGEAVGGGDAPVDEAPFDQCVDAGGAFENALVGRLEHEIVEGSGGPQAMAIFILTPKPTPRGSDLQERTRAAAQPEEIVVDVEERFGETQTSGDKSEGVGGELVGRSRQQRALEEDGAAHVAAEVEHAAVVDMVVGGDAGLGVEAHAEGPHLIGVAVLAQPTEVGDGAFAFGPEDEQLAFEIGVVLQGEEGFGIAGMEEEEIVVLPGRVDDDIGMEEIVFARQTSLDAEGGGFGGVETHTQRQAPDGAEAARHEVGVGTDVGELIGVHVSGADRDQVVEIGGIEMPVDGLGEGGVDVDAPFPAFVGGAVAEVDVGGERFEGGTDIVPRVAEAATPTAVLVEIVGPETVGVEIERMTVGVAEEFEILCRGIDGEEG